MLLQAVMAETGPIGPLEIAVLQHAIPTLLIIAPTVPSQKS